MEVKEVKVLEGKFAMLPSFATEGAAGADLRFNERMVQISAGETYMCGTGVHAEIPEGHVMLVFSRSGLACKQGLMLINGVGVIDSDYRGEIKVPLINMSNEPRFLNTGDRIAQAVILEVPKVKYAFAAALSDTERGEGGFGSTGVK